MSKTTDRLDKLETAKHSNLSVASGTCWSLKQLNDMIEEYDSHNEMVKLEVVHGFEPGKKCYHWTLFYYQHDWSADDE